MALSRAVLVSARRSRPGVQLASAWCDCSRSADAEGDQPGSSGHLHACSTTAPTFACSTSGLTSSAFPWHGPTAMASVRGMAWWSRQTTPSTPVQPSELHLSSDDGVTTQPGTADPSASAAALPAPYSTPAPSTSTSDPSASLQEAVDSITQACSQTEMASILTAQEHSVLLGPTFVKALQFAHEQGGLPWWASIALINVLTRTVALPVILANQRTSARMMAINADVLPLKKLQEAQKLAITTQQQAHIQQCIAEKVQEIQLKHGSQISGIMGTMFLTLAINSIIFISIFNGVNNLMNQKVPSLTQGGTLWFPDLTLPDPYYGLPVICALTTLAMIQYGMNVTGDQMATPERAEQSNRIKNIFRVFALMFIPLGHWFPSGVAMLWASNSAFSVLLGIMLRQDPLRRAVGLPALAEVAALGERVQAMSAADPRTFVLPMPAGDVQQQEQPGQQAPPPPPAGWGQAEQVPASGQARQ